MGRALSWVTAVTFAALVVAPRSARADGGATETTYAIQNLDAYPDKVFVAWPRSCGSTGDPLGSVSLQLNPDWVARLHEVDYEVLEKGKRHAVASYCLSTMQIHALPAADFPRASRIATADDSSLGKKPGEPLAILPALDAIELPKRIPFFASDPRQATLPFRFEAGLHHDLVIASGDGGLTLSLANAPPATADAGVDAGPSVAVPPAPSHDLGTRWVYAAAIGGLLAGGAIAHYRKKRAASAK